MCSESVEIIPNVWCGANFAEGVKMSCRHFSWQAQYFVRDGGVEVKFSQQAEGIVRLRHLVEVSVAVPLGLCVSGCGFAWQGCLMCSL